MKSGLQFLVVIAGIATILGSATAPPQARWKQQGATAGEFAQAKYKCMKSTSEGSELSSVLWSTATDQPKQLGVKTAVPSCQMYRACMESEGWALTNDGAFAHNIDCVKP